MGSSERHDIISLIFNVLLLCRIRPGSGADNGFCCYLRVRGCWFEFLQQYYLVSIIAAGCIFNFANRCDGFKFFRKFMFSIFVFRFGFFVMDCVVMSVVSTSTLHQKMKCNIFCGWLEESLIDLILINFKSLMTSLSPSIRIGRWRATFYVIQEEAFKKLSNHARTLI